MIRRIGTTQRQRELQGVLQSLEDKRPNCRQVYLLDLRHLSFKKIDFLVQHSEKESDKQNDISQSIFSALQVSCKDRVVLLGRVSFPLGKKRL